MWKKIENASIFSWAERVLKINVFYMRSDSDILLYFATLVLLLVRHKGTIYIFAIYIFIIKLPPHISKGTIYICYIPFYHQATPHISKRTIYIYTIYHSIIKLPPHISKFLFLLHIS